MKELRADISAGHVQGRSKRKAVSAYMPSSASCDLVATRLSLQNGSRSAFERRIPHQPVREGHIPTRKLRILRKIRTARRLTQYRGDISQERKWLQTWQCGRTQSPHTVSARRECLGLALENLTASHAIGETGCILEICTRPPKPPFAGFISKYDGHSPQAGLAGWRFELTHSRPNRVSTKTISKPGTLLNSDPKRRRCNQSLTVPFSP